VERAIAMQGDTLDTICWRHYGRTAGVVEQVLEANPGLADLGPTLPHGTPVNLPAAPAQAEQRQMVNLWD
jgi:phage tail protein X